MRTAESELAGWAHDTMVVDFVSRITKLFADYPQLIGFSVLERASLTAEREPAGLDGKLSVADVSVDPWAGVQASATARQIAASLAELLEQHPGVRGLLNGYAFARTFH